MYLKNRFKKTNNVHKPKGHIDGMRQQAIKQDGLFYLTPGVKEPLMLCLWDEGNIPTGWSKVYGSKFEWGESALLGKGVVLANRMHLGRLGLGWL